MIKELVFEKQKWVNQKDYLSKDYVHDNYVSKSEQSLIGKTVHVATTTPVFGLNPYGDFDGSTIGGEDKSINAGDYTISGEYQGNWINVLNSDSGWINLDTVIQNGGSVR